MLLGVIVMDCSIDGCALLEKSSALARCQQIPIEFKDVTHIHTHTGFSFIILFLSLVSYSEGCPAAAAASSLSLSLYVCMYVCGRRRRVSIDPGPLFIATSFNRAGFDFLLRPEYIAATVVVVNLFFFFLFCLSYRRPRPRQQTPGSI